MIRTHLHIRLAAGVTRRAILIGPYAIKFPRMRNGWHHFLHGLLSNITERTFSGFLVYRDYTVAPTIWRIPGGFMNVQRRALPLTRDQWRRVLDDKDVIDAGLDVKYENFGTIVGKIVLIDYGEITLDHRNERRYA